MTSVGLPVADIVRGVRHAFQYRQRMADPGLYLIFRDGSELHFRHMTLAGVEQGPTGLLVREPDINLQHFFAYATLAYVYVEER